MNCTASEGAKRSDNAPTSGFQPQATCDECGATGAWVFGDRVICEGCYVKAGSCCAESEIGDDSE